MTTRPATGDSVTVVGCGRSGVAVTRLLLAHGAVVTIVDDAPRERLRESAAAEQLPVACRFGAPVDAPLPDAGWIVVSPGVPTDTPRFARAVAAGSTLVGELAFASWYCSVPMLVVTGTNGKTTTATLLHHILEAAGVSAVLAGNVGRAFSGVVADVTAEQVVVLEASSFQLEHALGFAPRVGAILNLTPDHLDRYPDFQAYVAAKRTLWDRLPDGSLAVANADDPAVASETASYTGRLAWFGTHAPATPAMTVDRQTVVFHRDGGRTPVLPVADIPLLGPHNVSNVLAALACASDICDDLTGLAEGVRTFQPVEHRLQPVCEVAGVLYVNDSKATNVSATRTALEAISRPTVLLLGGRGKGTGYRELRPLLQTRVRQLVVFGEDASQILADVGDCVPTAEVESLAEAVARAAEAAEPGDAVLLSPACASFDMFRDFEERGQAFRALVEAL